MAQALSRSFLRFKSCSWSQKDALRDSAEQRTALKNPVRAYSTSFAVVREATTGKLKSTSTEVDYDSALNELLTRLSDESETSLTPDWQAGVWLAPRKKTGLKENQKQTQDEVSEEDEMGGRTGQTISPEVGTSKSERKPSGKNKSRDVWIKPGSTLSHSRLPEQVAAAKEIPRKAFQPSELESSSSKIDNQPGNGAGNSAVSLEEKGLSSKGTSSVQLSGGATFRMQSDRAQEVQDSGTVLETAEKAQELGVEALQATNEWLILNNQKKINDPEAISINQRVRRTPRMFNFQGSNSEGGIKVKPRRLGRKTASIPSDSETEEEAPVVERKLEREKASALETAKEVVVKVASAAAIAAGQMKTPAFPTTDVPMKKLKINLDLDIYRGRTLVFKRHFSQAEAIFYKCIRDFPEDGRAYCQLAKLMERRGDIDGARSMYESAEAVVRGENAYVWQMYAVLEERAGNLSKARKLLDAALVVNKSHAAAWHSWGLLEKRDGNLAKGKSLFLKGLRFCPTNGYLHQELAIMEREAGNVEQAREYFEKGTIYCPRSSALWQAWALLEAEDGNEEAARKLFKKALEISPRSAPTHTAWALFEARCGRSQAALELFEAGLQFRPRDVVLLQAYARFLYEEGNVTRARLLFKRATALDPKHQPSWQAWAIMEWKEGNVPKSRELFQKGIWAAPKGTNVAKVFQAWGVLEEREGNLTVARELYKCALKADPTSDKAWQSWAMLEENVGNIFRADELRRLCAQQQTEIVSVDLSLSEVLAPTFSKIKEWFSFKEKAPVGRALPPSARSETEQE